MHPNIRQDSHAMQWGEVNFGWYTHELLASEAETPPRFTILFEAHAHNLL